MHNYNYNKDYEIEIRTNNKITSMKIKLHHSVVCHTI